MCGERERERERDERADKGHMTVNATMLQDFASVSDAF